jgi:hypothetical protein
MGAGGLTSKGSGLVGEPGEFAVRTTVGTELDAERFVGYAAAELGDQDRFTGSATCSLEPNH